MWVSIKRIFFPLAGPSRRNKLVKVKIRRLAFTSLFPFYLKIIYISFAHTSLDVMVLQVGKIRVLDLPETYHVSAVNKKTQNLKFGS